jgi:hypothetical protein
MSVQAFLRRDSDQRIGKMMRNFTGAFIYIYISIGMYIHIIIYRIVCITIIIERSLEVKLSTIWTDGKGEVGRVREEKSRSEKIRERVRRKKMQVREKGRKVAIHCVFPMICGSGGSKSRLVAKAAGAERGEKLHAVVARSAFPSQNAQSTPTSEHFRKL